MAGAHYPLHCLHSAAGSHPHHQHHHHSSPYSGSAGSYNHRSLAAYPYVSHSQHSPYLQSYHNSSAASQTRADDAGEPAPASPTRRQLLSPRPPPLHPRPPPGQLRNDPRRGPRSCPGRCRPWAARPAGERGGGGGCWLPRPLRGPAAAVPGGGAAALPPPRPAAAAGGTAALGTGASPLAPRPAGRGLRSALLCYGGTGFGQNSC